MGFPMLNRRVVQPPTSGFSASKNGDARNHGENETSPGMWFIAACLCCNNLQNELMKMRIGMIARTWSPQVYQVRQAGALQMRR